MNTAKQQKNVFKESLVQKLVFGIDFKNFKLN